MIKVDQTKFGEEKGDCMRACLASLLELPLEDVPELECNETTWWRELQNWLAPLGYSALEVHSPVGKCEDGEPAFPNEGQICWAIGKSPRGDLKHAVLAEWTKGAWLLRHDPHPDRTGLDGEPELIGMIVAKDKPFERKDWVCSVDLGKDEGTRLMVKLPDDRRLVCSLQGQHCVLYIRSGPEHKYPEERVILANSWDGCISLSAALNQMVNQVRNHDTADNN